MVLDGDGRPVVAWEDDTSGNREIYVRRFDGERWVAIHGSAGGGGVSNSAAPSRNPSLAYHDGTGRL